MPNPRLTMDWTQVPKSVRTPESTTRAGAATRPATPAALMTLIARHTTSKANKTRKRNG